jgi:hypothetical protein
MKKKEYYSESESKENTGNNKLILSKFDYELFDEEKYKPERIIRIKKINSPNKGEKWKIMEDDKVIFVLDGLKLSKKERDFLRTPDGFSFLISQQKTGIKSFNSLRQELKKKIN